MYPETRLPERREKIVEGEPGKNYGKKGTISGKKAEQVLGIWYIGFEQW